MKIRIHKPGLIALLLLLFLGLVLYLLFIYFMVNTGLQARRLALLDQKRLDRRIAKEKKEQEIAEDSRQVNQDDHPISN